MACKFCGKFFGEGILLRIPSLFVFFDAGIFFDGLVSLWHPWYPQTLYLTNGVKTFVFSK